MKRTSISNPYLGIALVAMGVISYEIILMRLFALESYATFGYMIISIALLGFGLSGIVITQFQAVFRKNIAFWLYVSSLLTIPVIAAARYYSVKIPFVPPSILQDSKQVAYIAQYYLTLFVPFFFASFYVGLALTGYAEKVNRLYAFDLAGSGIGALITLACMYYLHPRYLLLVVLTMIFLGNIITTGIDWSSRRTVLRSTAKLATAVVVFAGVMLYMVRHNTINLSEYKAIQYEFYAKKVSKARIVAESFSPLGYIQVVESKTYRSAIGLSLSAPVNPPSMYGLYVDGDNLGPVSKKLTQAESRYLDYLITSVPYKLLSEPKVLVIGIGGGTTVREALHHGASKVTAVDIDPKMIDMVRHRLRDYTGGLLDDPRVRVVIGEGRSYATTSGRRFDLIMIAGQDGSGMSFAGSPSIGENYVFTVEALKGYLHALSLNGILAITLNIKDDPQSNSGRIIPSMIQAMRELYGDTGDLHKRFMFLRDMSYGTALIKRSGFDSQEIARLRTYCADRSWDLSYFPGITPADVQKNMESDRDYFHEIAQAMFFDKDHGRRFMAGYMFDLSPTRDDRPYFKASFHWTNTIPWIKSTLPKNPGWRNIARNLPVSLWSYALLWITLAQAVLFGLLIVIIPILTHLLGRLALLAGQHRLARRLSPFLDPTGRSNQATGGKVATIVYFCCLGFGFLIMEMLLIQKFTLFLASPLYATSLVLAGILIFSGLGSMYSQRYAESGEMGIHMAAGAIALTCGIYAIALDPILEMFLTLPQGAKIAISMLLLGPISFFLGLPFPMAIRALVSDRPNLIPWAWAINGATSVSAIVLATLLSIHFGFKTVFTIVALLYLLALASFPTCAKRHVALLYFLVPLCASVALTLYFDRFGAYFELVSILGGAGALTPVVREMMRATT